MVPTPEISEEALAASKQAAQNGSQQTNVQAVTWDAVIRTPHGDIRLILFPDDAPLTVSNFRKLALTGYYDGLAFHRVVPGLLFKVVARTQKRWRSAPCGNWGPGYTIKCETEGSPHKHRPGTLSMAHAGKDTGGSQFLSRIALPHLDGKHTIFGKVVGRQDMNVVYKIREGDRFSVELMQGLVT